MTRVYTRREEFVMPMNITEFTAGCRKRISSAAIALTALTGEDPRDRAWFNNTYILRLSDLEFEVPVSRSKVKEFRQLMRL